MLVLVILLGLQRLFLERENAETRAISNGKYETAIMGYAGRFTYAYDSKYLLEVNGRYDGSYKFSKESRFGFFHPFR